MGNRPEKAFLRPKKRPERTQKNNKRHPKVPFRIPIQLIIFYIVPKAPAGCPSSVEDEEDEFGEKVARSRPAAPYSFALSVGLADG